jgi:hypothetical protein
VLLGFLWVFDPDDSLSDDKVVDGLDVAERLVVELAKAPRFDMERRSREQAATEALLAGDATSAGLAARDAVSGGLLVRGAAHLVVAARPVSGHEAQPWRDDAVLNFDAVRRHLAMGSAITGSLASSVAMILVAPSAEAMANATERITRDLPETTAQRGWVLGLGPRVDRLAEVRVSLAGAMTALEVHRRIGGMPTPADWNHLGSWRLIARLPDDELTRASLHPAIEMLRRQPNTEDLLHTLRTFLERGGDVRATADEIFLHRASLYARLKRIEALTGVDLGDGEQRLSLHLSLKAADWLAASPDQDPLPASATAVAATRRQP